MHGCINISITESTKLVFQAVSKPMIKLSTNSLSTSIRQKLNQNLRDSCVATSSHFLISSFLSHLSVLTRYTQCILNVTKNGYHNIKIYQLIARIFIKHPVLERRLTWITSRCIITPLTQTLTSTRLFQEGRTLQRN